ncbi:hypothetical protein NEOLI_004117 [Neolecta irregularis DAH-3]|uniref:Cell wall protein phiA n=1 Tax=Neolecta irregularis (strain DAH-3) TaxID=1198029 RepID=A0A1U7LSD2_NEOID|nr:hypothetical protein NEOLI_004117 [Neolecta irregularis DAH-3]|eukprot:OLL25528.1 hypothetical protein NEOLI_004117 [Neolecta irregularis DAH-3]
MLKFIPVLLLVVASGTASPITQDPPNTCNATIAKSHDIGFYLFATSDIIGKPLNGSLLSTTIIGKKTEIAVLRGYSPTSIGATLFSLNDGVFSHSGMSAHVLAESGRILFGNTIGLHDAKFGLQYDCENEDNLVYGNGSGFCAQPVNANSSFWTVNRVKVADQGTDCIPIELTLAEIIPW